MAHTTGAFARALKNEFPVRDMLINDYITMNRQVFGPTPDDLRVKAEAWADKLIADGKVSAYFDAMANAHVCPHCGRGDV